MHYDLRLQFGDVLKSWAVTNVPSFDPQVRRLAVHVEDHPLAYANFEGAIPKGEYGAGHVLIWDRGTWDPTADPDEGYARGVLKFQLAGEKLKGGWTLVRMKRKERNDNWLLIKERDSFARAGDPSENPDEAQERSVVSGRSLDDLRAPPSVAAAAVPGARRAPMADFVKPQLAAQCDDPPEGGDWLHELKFDGYRTLARVEDGQVRFLTRNGLDWTTRYGNLGRAFNDLTCQRALLDGEVVVQDEQGVSDFARLQEALATNDSHSLLFFAFDLLHLDDHDLRDAPLAMRKQVLSTLLSGVKRNSPLQLSEYVVGDGARMFDEACRMAVEGIVSKRLDAPYRSGRGWSWRKSKCGNAGDFVIVGYTRTAAAGGLAALLMAEAGEDGTFSYVGKTGTGFSRSVAADLESRLEALRVDQPTVKVPGDVTRQRPLWVTPTLIAEVRFATRTSDGRLRQAVFKGLRPDKAPASVEEASVGDSPARPPRRWVSDADLASVWVTNPEREMFGGPTKLDLALYYARVGDWLMTQVAERPLTLVRCPTGLTKDCFYQRNVTPGMPEAVRRTLLPAAGDEPEEMVMHVDDAAGLLALVQFGVVELHCRGCRVVAPEHPDRIVFDLDPDEGLGWPVVVDAAFFLRERLTSLGFVPFVKTTGGKGLHIVVPVIPRSDWQQVLAFAQGFAAALASAEPKRFTKNMAKRARKNRIFIDYLRNGRSATAVAAYSLRARPGVTVATPVSWDELPRIDDPRAFDWRSVPQRLAQLAADPWHDIAAGAREISKQARQFAGVAERVDERV